MTRLARSLALVMLLAVPAPSHAAGPRLATTGRMVWDLPAPVAVAPSESAYVALTRDTFPAVAALARVRLATMRLAAGDTSSAESLLAVPVASNDIGAWPRLRALAGLWAARGRPSAADSLLENVGRESWPEPERASWLEQRMQFARARGDSARAAAWAEQIVRVFPGTASATPALRLLDASPPPAGDSAAVSLARAGAEVDALRARRAEAVARLRAARPRARGADRGEIALRIAELLRQSRRPLAARAAADSARDLAADETVRARAQLEVSRSLRDAGESDSALARYARLARPGTFEPVRSTAAWELARECEDRGRLREAAQAFARLGESGEARADEARARAGIALWTLGDSAGARSWLRRSSQEAARFWLAISLRASDRAACDSLWRSLARTPAFGFYAALARESLSVRGWNGAVADPGAEASPTSPLLDAVARLAAVGDDEDAQGLFARAATGDPRLRGSARADAALPASRLAFANGWLAPGTRAADRALADAARSPDSLAWAVVPWQFPPAYEREVVAAESLGVPRALLWALMRQESRFDPRARSKSDALGLTQLKTQAAGDMARFFRDAPPTDSALFVPATAIRYGARYLAMLLKRFDGHVAVALAAYNAGPGTIRKDWRELIARGGEALFAEYASNADSQDYVKRILGFRRAYDELKPTTQP